LQVKVQIQFQIHISKLNNNKKNKMKNNKEVHSLVSTLEQIFKTCHQLQT
jgi:hypothetical protein